MRWYELKEAARLTGKSESRLRGMLNKGEITGRKAKKGKREYWEVSQSVIDELNQSVNNGYEDLLQEWEAAMNSGLSIKKPINPSTIKHYKNGLSNYWHYLGLKPDLAHISTENLRVTLSRIGVDHKKQKCHYGLKLRVYAAYRSFMGFLIYKGIRTENELLETRDLLPRRVYPARKTVLEERTFEKMLVVNDAHQHSRTDFDMASCRTMMLLMGLAGLRNSEVCNLKVHQVDLKERVIRISLGKGFKDRKVGITTMLAQQLAEYLKLRPDSEHDNLLLSRTGKPLNPNRIWYKLQTIAQKAKLDITPHGLRRTFATVNVKNGMPLPVAQKLLGHTDIKITMEYIMIDEMQAVDYLRGQ